MDKPSKLANSVAQTDRLLDRPSAIRQLQNT